MGLTLNAYGRVLVGQNPNFKQIKELQAFFNSFLNCRSQVQSLPWSPSKYRDIIAYFQNSPSSVKSLNLPILCTELHDARRAYGRILVGLRRFRFALGWSR